MYNQLPETDKEDYHQLMAAMISAFCASPFSAYSKLRTRQLKAEEAPDVYLSDIRSAIRMLNGVQAAARCVKGVPVMMKVEIVFMDCLVAENLVGVWM